MSIEQEHIIAELEDQLAVLRHRLGNVEKLCEGWMHYCHMSGQTGRIIEEVRDVVAGREVMVGSQWLRDLEL